MYSMTTQKDKLARAITTLSEREYAARYFFTSPKREYTQEGLDFVLGMFSRLSGNHALFAHAAISWLWRFIEGKDSNSLTHKQVAEALLVLASHSEVMQSSPVQHSAIVLSTKLKPKDAAKLIYHVSEMQKLNVVPVGLITQYLGHIVKAKRISKSYVNNVLSVVSTLLSPREVTHKCDKTEWTSIESAYTWNEISYELSSEVIPNLIKKNPYETYKALSNVLNRVADITRPMDADISILDGSGSWLASIEDSDQNFTMDDTFPGAILFWARDALDKLRELNEIKWTRAIRELSKGEWCYQIRLCMYSLTNYQPFGSDELSDMLEMWTELMMKGADLVLYHEFWELLRTRGNELTSDQIRRITGILRQGLHNYPDSISAKEGQQYDELRLRDIMVALEPVLEKREDLTPLLTELRNLRKKYGKERTWVNWKRIISKAEWEKPIPDYTAGDLLEQWKLQGVDVVVANLLSRPPKRNMPFGPERFSETADNSPSLREASASDPEFIIDICNAKESIGLHADYIEALAMGLHDAIQLNKKPSSSDVGSYVKALEAIIRHYLKTNERNGILYSVSFAIEDIGWKLYRGRKPTISKYLDITTPFLHTRTEERPIVEDEPIEWLAQAINTTEGRCFEGLLYFINTLCHKTRTKRAHKLASLLYPYIDDLLDLLISARANPFLTAQAGAYFNTLYLYFNDLDRDHKLRFREVIEYLLKDESTEFRRAFTCGYLSRASPVKEYWSLLRPLYARALKAIPHERLKDALSYQFAHLWWHRDGFDGASELVEDFVNSDIYDVRTLVCAFTNQDSLWTSDNWQKHLRPLWDLAAHSSASYLVKVAFINWLEKLPDSISIGSYLSLLKSSIDSVPAETREFWELRDLFAYLLRRARKRGQDELGLAVDLALLSLRKLAKDTYIPFVIKDAESLYKLAKAKEDDASLQNTSDMLAVELRRIGATPPANSHRSR